MAIQIEVVYGNGCADCRNGGVALSANTPLVLVRKLAQPIAFRFCDAGRQPDPGLAVEQFQVCRAALTVRDTVLAVTEADIGVGYDRDGFLVLAIAALETDTEAVRTRLADSCIGRSDEAPCELACQLEISARSTVDDARFQVWFTVPAVIRNPEKTLPEPEPAPELVYWSAQETRCAIAEAMVQPAVGGAAAVTNGIVRLARSVYYYSAELTAATDLVFDTSLLVGGICSFELQITFDTLVTVHFPSSVRWAGNRVPNFCRTHIPYYLRFRSEGGGWVGEVVYGDTDEQLIYGVIYDARYANTYQACQRVVYRPDQGLLIPVEKFEHMPGHDFRRCVMDNLAERHVNYYLAADDSSLKADGSAADLTGADGDVMVEIPVCHWRMDLDHSGRVTYLLSRQPFAGSEVHPFFKVSPDGTTVRTQYVGAYQSTLCDDSGIRLPGMMDQSAGAPCAYAAGFRARSVAGCKPWTSMTQATHRSAAAANGAVGVNSLFHQYLMLMMLIEGGGFDVQTTISPGFSYASTWNYAFTRLSGRANFGNGTGSVWADPAADAAITWQSVSDPLKVVQFAYRGIENPYGEIWKFEDGIQKYQNAADGALTDGCYWATSATAFYTDLDQNAAEVPVYVPTAHPWPVTGWTKTWRADSFFALSVGGTAGTYMGDYLYNNTMAGARVVLRGGSMLIGAINGMGAVDVSNPLSSLYGTFGARIAA